MCTDTRNDSEPVLFVVAGVRLQGTELTQITSSRSLFQEHIANSLRLVPSQVAIFHVEHANADTTSSQSDVHAIELLAPPRPVEKGAVGPLFITSTAGSLLFIPPCFLSGCAQVWSIFRWSSLPSKRSPCWIGFNRRNFWLTSAPARPPRVSRCVSVSVSVNVSVSE